jgi:hypothetical protein
MSQAVYLMGHGRVDAETPVIIPEKITMHWLGYLGDVSNGISYAFLNGSLTEELPNSGPGSAILQHYLCGERADVDPVTDTKIKNFFDRQTPHPFGCEDPYVIYPRGKTNVSVSSIFAFLQKFGTYTEWHLYWTCCRGYIGQYNPYTSKFDKEKAAVVRELRKEPEKTPELGDQGHKTVDADFETIRIMAKSDKKVIRDKMKEDPLYKLNMASPTEALEKLLIKV